MAGDSKVLLIMGIFAVLFGSLAWEEETCGAEILKATAYHPFDVFEKTSIASAETVNSSAVVIEGREMLLPFGLINGKWEELKRQYENGGCLFHYRYNCGLLCSSEGYALIRNGKIVDLVQTRIS